MLIRCGFDIRYQCLAQTSMLLQLNVHPSRIDDLRSPDVITSDPPLAMRAYLDHFGNRVTRVDVPPGPVAFRNSFVVYDNGAHDEAPPYAPVTPIDRLPDDVMLYLISSRYCDSDNLSSLAWSMFGAIDTAYGRVRAICDYAHSRIRFSYPEARPNRTASDALNEGVGVCRDYAHLAVALCRCMNIPARYCTGYLGDFGVPVDPGPMDFSAWFEVCILGRWYALDARHNIPRIGRIVMGRGRDAADVAISTAFGTANLLRFDVVTVEEATM